ncbi:MAG: GNAT family N-acetyltransferase [Oscillospiraceae bacterium]|nr:GNAT family N-acetyltransferase [Oscillospiraceae bacterium]
MIIKKFEPKYRDDLIFMVLLAKDALGRVPGLNEDLLDIQKCYFDKDDMFWIAVDDNDRVIGSAGFSSIENSSEIYLHRLFVKPDMKHKGIGTQLLKTVENYAVSKGKTAVYVHLGRPKEQWYESYSFYPKNGYHEYQENAPHLMKKEL